MTVQPRSFLSDLLRMGRSKTTIILCSIASAALTARYLGPAGSGAYAGLLVYPSLFMSLGALGIRQSATLMIGRHAIEEDEIRQAIVTVWIGTSLLGVLISFMLIAGFSSYHGFPQSVLAVIAIPFSLYASYVSGIYLGRNDIIRFNRVDWIPAVATLAGNVLLVAILGLGLRGALIAQAVGPLLVFSITLRRYPIFLQNYRFNFGLIVKLLRFGLVFSLSLLVINLNYRIDVILLDRLSSAEQLGLYSKGASITQYMWQLPMLLSTLVFARSAIAQDDRAQSMKIARLLRLSILGVGGLSLLLWFSADLVVQLLYGPAFQQSASVMRILIPGVLILTLFKVMNMDLAGKGKPWVAIGAMAPALTVNIGVNMVLIPRLGAGGAAWASTISYSIAGILFVILYSRITHIPLRSMFTFQKADFEFVIAKLRRR